MATPPTSQQLLAAANIASTNLNFQIPSISIKLDRENYSLWRTTIISPLETFDLESFILNPMPPPATLSTTEASGTSTTTSNPEFTTWKKRDNFVLLWIKSTLSERCLATVARSSSSQHAWQALERTFQTQTRARRMAMKTQLQTISKGALSMLEYIERKRPIADSLAEDLTPVSDEDLINYILNGLDASYGAFTSAFLMKSDNATVDDLVGHLLQEEAQLELETARQASLQVPPVSMPSLQANVASRSHHRSIPYSRSSGNSSTNYKVPTQQSDQRRRRVQCQICNKQGHEAIDCWQRGNQADYPSRRLNPKDPTKQAYTTNYSSPSAVIDPNWYFDTGATDHVSPDLNKLQVSDPYTGEEKLQVGNDLSGKTGTSRPCC